MEDGKLLLVTQSLFKHYLTTSIVFLLTQVQVKHEINVVKNL